MKCPECGLVTFDHLSRCPKCRATFRLARRLTRRPDPSRRIVLPVDARRGDGGTADDAVAETRADVADAAPTAAASGKEPTPPRTPASTGPRSRPSDPPVRDATATTSEDGSPRPSPTPARRPGADPGPSPSEAAADLAPAPTGPAFRAPPPADPPDRRDKKAERIEAPARDFSRYPLRRSADEHEADRRRMKERMIAASRERRGARPERRAGAVDPLLPDWYVPDTDDNEAESGPATASRTE